jgi:TrmH family RNA methyltransferase
MKDENRADYRQLDAALTLTRIRKLQGDRCYRDQHRLFFIEGVRNFVEAIDRGFPVETLLYSEKLLTAPLPRKFVRQLKRAGVPFARVFPALNMHPASPPFFISESEHLNRFSLISSPAGPS